MIEVHENGTDILMMVGGIAIADGPLPIGYIIAGVFLLLALLFMSASGLYYYFIKRKMNPA